MGQGERAYDGVDRVAGKREPVQVGLAEVDVREALAGPGEHVRGGVDAGDPVAESVQVGGVTAGAAGHVQIAGGVVVRCASSGSNRSVCCEAALPTPVRHFTSRTATSPALLCVDALTP